MTEKVTAPTSSSPALTAAACQARRGGRRIPAAVLSRRPRSGDAGIAARRRPKARRNSLSSPAMIQRLPRFQVCAKSIQSTVNTRARGGHRDPGDACNLLEGHIHVEVEEEHQALFGAEPVKRTVDVKGVWVAIASRSLVVKMRHLQHGPPACAAHAAALIGHDAQGPR